MVKFLLLDHLEALVTVITEVKLVPILLYRLRDSIRSEIVGYESLLQESALGVSCIVLSYESPM